MIVELGDPDRNVPVAKSFHEQTDEELTENEVKQMEADDQAIQTILLGLPKYIYAVVDSWIANQNRNGNLVAARAKGNQASSSGTQADKAPIYDSNGSVEVHQYENCYNSKIFNLFTQEEQYTDLLKSTTMPHLDQQNDSNVISSNPNIKHSGGTVEQHHATVEETCAYFESLYNNLVIKVK
nr:hypothetical protein [Tanacetum cinerariifolium]